jgi:hypothetical protein
LSLFDKFGQCLRILFQEETPDSKELITVKKSDLDKVAEHVYWARNGVTESEYVGPAVRTFTKQRLGLALRWLSRTGAKIPQPEKKKETEPWITVTSKGRQTV